jgi:hypothetical protein
MSDIKNSPHYQNGYYWGTKASLSIEHSIYGNIPAAINSKQMLLKDLNENFNWGDEHEKVQDLKGFIQALTDKLNSQNEK